MSRAAQRNSREESAHSAPADSSISDLPGKISRYSVARHRTLGMAKYISSHARESNDRSSRILGGLADRLLGCGNRLTFRHYYTADILRLHRAVFCKKSLLCPLCAIRRASKSLQVVVPKVESLTRQYPRLKPYLVTFTVKDDESLHLAFQKLTRGISRLLQARRDAHKPRCLYVEAAKALAGVYGIEVKRGKNSGLWHPHVHMVWFCDEEPDKVALIDQWKRYTSDSYIVDVRPFRPGPDVADGLMEVLKYALKFSDLSLEDNFEAFNLLAGRRLFGSFGALRGLKLPDDLLDDCTDLADLPYIELIYQYMGTGYTLTGTRRSTDEAPFDEYWEPDCPIPY